MLEFFAFSHQGCVPNHILFSSFYYVLQLFSQSMHCCMQYASVGTRHRNIFDPLPRTTAQRIVGKIVSGLLTAKWDRMKYDKLVFLAYCA